MATKSGREEPEKAEVVEEMLDTLDTAIDRVKVLYEQYFLGIQKQPPTFLHTDVERQLRDITQLQVRNTALRYRFATLQQKFGAYHAYWRRTLRQIENGTYMRNLSKIGRQAARTGAEIPEEILAAMPRRMREQIKRDREAALALAELRHRSADDLELLTLVDETIDDQTLAAIVQESAEPGHDRAASGAHVIDAADADFDVDAFFAAITNERARDGEPASPPSPPSAAAVDQTAGPAPLAPPSPGIDAPVIRWRRSSPAAEPRPLEARSGALPTGHPGPAAEPGSPTIADAAGHRAPGTESSSLDLSLDPPTVRRPSTDRPGTERPAPRRPSSDRPGTERPTLRRPASDWTSTERPTLRRPASDWTSTERPTARRPSTERPSTEPPSSRRPTTERPSTEQPPMDRPAPRRPSTDPAVLGRPSTDRPGVRAPSSGEGSPSADVRHTAQPGTDRPNGERPSTGRTHPRLPTVRPPIPDAEPTAAPGAGRLNIGPPGSAPPTVRLTGPGAGRPKVGRPSSAPSSSEPPVAEAPAAGLPDARPPDAGHPSISAEQPADEPSTTGARAPVSTERPAVIKLKIVQPNTASPTVRLLRPGAGRSGSEPASDGAEPARAEQSGSGARPLESSDAQLNIAPLSDDLSTARMLSPGAGRSEPSSADLLSAGPPSPGAMTDDQSTARLLSPVPGRWSTGQTAELPSTGQPSLAQLTDDQSTARLWSAIRPDTGPSSAGHSGAGAEPPSTGDPRPPAPPPGGRPTPPRVMPPPIRPPSAQASPQPSGPPSAQPVRPEPPRPPAPAPSQATRPIPISPGAAATRTPGTVEALSGPFPRIPIPPPIPNKARPASGAPPAAEERPVSPERPPPIPAASRATPVRPGTNQPVPASSPPAERAPTGEPAPAPSGERPPPVRPSAPPRPPPPPPLPRAAADRRAPEPRQAPPPGMSDAEVNALYAKYIQAKQTLGEDAGPDAYGKLLKTIHAQAPKIMEQYKATGVDFSVVVKDNQVIIRAKPKP